MDRCFPPRHGRRPRYSPTERHRGSRFRTIRKSIPCACGTVAGMRNTGHKTQTGRGDDNRRCLLWGHPVGVFGHGNHPAWKRSLTKQLFIKMVSVLYRVSHQEARKRHFIEGSLRTKGVSGFCLAGIITPVDADVKVDKAACHVVQTGTKKNSTSPLIAQTAGAALFSSLNVSSAHLSPL